MKYKSFKNYSTQKSREETVEEIKILFEQIGIQDVLFKYEDNDPRLGILEYIEFRLEVNEFDEVKICRIYVNARNVQKALEQQKIRGKLKGYINEYIAEKVSCRNIKDFLHTQVVLIQSGIITIGKAFFAFIHVDDKSTLYEKYKNGLVLLKE